MDRFSGFPPDALAFYAGLAADNSKTYFDAHREVYESCVREPLELLLVELAPEFGTGKVFRPHRDVRFSKDKSPYKLAASAVLSRDGAACTAHYVELSAAGLRLGGGMWSPIAGSSSGCAGRSTTRRAARRSPRSPGGSRRTAPSSTAPG